MLWKGLSQSIWISKNLCSKIGNNINVVVFVQSQSLLCHEGGYVTIATDAAHLTWPRGGYTQSLLVMFSMSNRLSAEGI